MLPRVVCLVFSAFVLGCATTTVPQQFEGVAISGLDRGTRDQCVRDAISPRINTPTWRVISTTPVMSGEIDNFRMHVALWGKKQTIQKDKLRFVKLTLRGKGYLGQQTNDIICMFELRESGLHYLQYCEISNDRLDRNCVLRFDLQ